MFYRCEVGAGEQAVENVDPANAPGRNGRSGTKNSGAAATCVDMTAVTPCAFERAACVAG